MDAETLDNVLPVGTRKQEFSSSICLKRRRRKKIYTEGQLHCWKWHCCVGCPLGNSTAEMLVRLFGEIFLRRLFAQMRETQQDLRVSHIRSTGGLGREMTKLRKGNNPQYSQLSFLRHKHAEMSGTGWGGIFAPHSRSGTQALPMVTPSCLRKLSSSVWSKLVCETSEIQVKLAEHYLETAFSPSARPHLDGHSKPQRCWELSSLAQLTFVQFISAAVEELGTQQSPLQCVGVLLAPGSLGRLLEFVRHCMKVLTFGSLANGEHADHCPIRQEAETSPAAESTPYDLETNV